MNPQIYQNLPDTDTKCWFCGEIRVHMLLLKDKVRESAEIKRNKSQGSSMATSRAPAPGELNSMAHFTEQCSTVSNVNGLPREILHMIFETFNTDQGMRRGRLSLLVQQYIRNPDSVSFDKGYHRERTAIFRCLYVCKLWREIVLDVLFAKSHRCLNRKERTSKHLGLVLFIRDAECFRPRSPSAPKELTMFHLDFHKKCRWQDTCACESAEEIAECPYRDFD